MPFLEDDNTLNLAARHDAPKGFAVTPGASDLEDKGDKPAWNWGAAFRRNNETAALAASESMWQGNEPEPGFNPWEKVKGTSDEVNFRPLSEARNQKKFDAIKADIARENEDRKLLESQPWWMGLITEGSAGILSPTTLIPGGTFVKGAKGGIAVAKAAASVGAANAVSAAVQEGALQGIEQTRTAGESAMPIGASLFLGGLLGAGGQAILSKADWQKGVANLDHDLAGVKVASDAKPVFDDVYGQLKATGMADEEARVNASVFAARYATRAERLGEGATPIDVYRGDGLEIRAGEKGTAEGVGVFNQSAEIVAQEKATLDKMMEDLRTDKSVADAAFKQMSKLGDAKDEWAKVLGAEPGGIELASSNSRNRLTAGVTRSQQDPNGWRVTYFDERGFSGHTEYKTKEQAVSAALDEGYTVPAPGALRKAMESGTFFQAAEKADPRGKITVYKDNSAVIDLFKGADKSTFMHEAGHLWLNEIVRDAGKSAGIKSDLVQITKWLGVDDASKIELKHHEQWARGFEEYLRDGKAPSSALANAFESFKKWLTEIYKSLTNLGPDHVKINDDIRKVMDRMLATDREIAARDAGEVMGGAKSVGAASSDEGITLKDLSVYGKVAGFIADKTQKLNPGLRLIHSPSVQARLAFVKGYEFTPYLNMNAEGRTLGASAETRMQSHDGGLIKTIPEQKPAWLEYRKAGGELSYEEFLEEAGKAARRNDTVGNPHIDAVAKAHREKVIDPLTKEAVDVGLLKPEDLNVSTAESYFHRMWQSAKLIARELEFKSRVIQWVKSELPKWTDQYDKGVERRLNPIRKELGDLEMEKLRRAEELKQRGDDADTSEMTEGDIRQALRIVNGGAPKPKGVDTLSQFVLKQGGLVDDAGELAHRGITNKARPGLIRKERKTAQSKSGGWTLDDMARHAWENGYFPEHSQRPSIDTFVEALNDDFHKVRAVLKHGDEDAFKLTELVAQLEADLARAGVANDGKAPRFSTSEEMKGAVERVYKALDAEADRKIAGLKDRLAERETDARIDRESRFLGDPDELGKQIADDVFNSLTGRSQQGLSNNVFKITAKGPLQDRTFNAPDSMFEDFLENNIETVSRHFVKTVAPQVEIMRAFGSLDMAEQVTKIREDYDLLRGAAKTEKERLALRDREKRDIKDLRDLLDLKMGTGAGSNGDTNYGRIVRGVNNFNYIRQMGEVSLASLPETIMPAVRHGLMPYFETLGQTMSNLKGVKMSANEAQLAGNIGDRILPHTLSMMSEISDPTSKRTAVEAILDKGTDLASKWNGIRLLTDMQKTLASVMTQNRVLENAARYSEIKPKERAYMAFLKLDQSMAERIAKQFAEHGETVDKVRVANTEQWTDPVARNAYRSAINLDVNSTITTRSAADVPTWMNTNTGKVMGQFKGFALAAHQRVLLRGLQEDQARFLGSIIALTTMGMAVTWLKAQSGNRDEKLQDFTKNPGWWITEGADKAGFISVLMEGANMIEKTTSVNPIKDPFKVFDEGQAQSQKNQNRNVLGSLLGPSAGLVSDAASVAAIPKKMAAGDEITKGDKSSAERLMPFNSYAGIRQVMRYLVNTPQ
jgi:hypothetical protein